MYISFRFEAKQIKKMFISFRLEAKQKIGSKTKIFWKQNQAKYGVWISKRSEMKRKNIFAFDL